MGLYGRYVLPRLTHMAMRQSQLLPYRERTIRSATGRVLEIGIGSGLNLPLYGNAVTEVVGIDPSPELLAMAERAAALAMPGKTRLLEASAERLPIDDQSVDTVVVTWALCSIPDPTAALAEARRVLRPGGSLRFVEHGRSPDASVAWWQDRLTPLWMRCSGGCHLNRKTDDLVQSAGLRLTTLETGYARGPRPMTFMYEGVAALPGG
jgi:ubiquinone/menaquinone biosynthesis C-methylase UbiE